MLFSLGHNNTAALFPWERYILYPFWLTAISQLLCLGRVVAAKLAQAGFGDFLADARVSSLKGKCDDSKEVHLLIQSVTVPDTNRLTVNGKVQELKLLF